MRRSVTDDAGEVLAEDGGVGVAGREGGVGVNGRPESGVGAAGRGGCSGRGAGCAEALPPP